MREYASILADAVRNTLTGLIGFELSWDVILVVSAFIFFFWLVAFKL